MNKTLGGYIDPEWLELILSAKEIGLTIDEIREFLNNERDRQERAAQ